MSAQPEKVFCRGFSAINMEIAVHRRLMIPNNSVTVNVYDPEAPGLFFASGKDALTYAEETAMLMAKREQQKAFAMQLTITPDNFSHIAGKIYNVTPKRRDPSAHDYDQAQSFNDVRPQQAVVSMEHLSHEDLIALSCIVGTGTRVGRFRYTSYEELFQRYILNPKASDRQQTLRLYARTRLRNHLPVEETVWLDYCQDLFSPEDIAWLKQYQRRH
jgi:hypothetical protein